MAQIKPQLSQEKQGGIVPTMNNGQLHAITEVPNLGAFVALQLCRPLLLEPEAQSERPCVAAKANQPCLCAVRVFA